MEIYKACNDRDLSFEPVHKLARDEQAVPVMRHKDQTLRNTRPQCAELWKQVQ